MHEWLESLPWWSLLAVQSVGLAGYAWWTRVELRRLETAKELDAAAELKRAESVAAVLIGVTLYAYFLLPNPWKATNTAFSTYESLGVTVLLAWMALPVRARAVGIKEKDTALAVGALGEMFVTGCLYSSVVLSAVAFSAVAFTAIARHLLSPQWASLIVVVGVCATYGTALAILTVLGPLLTNDSDRGLVRDGVLFDIAEAAFRRAGLPAPKVYLVDGRLEGSHMVGYSGLQGGPGQPIVLVEARLLQVAAVRLMSAALRHEAAHAARGHVASMMFWKWLVLAAPAACAWLAGIAASRWAPGCEFILGGSIFAAVVLAVFVHSMRLSRRDEFDADADAVLRFGAESQDLIDALALIDGLNRTPAEQSFWESRTHPSLIERAAELRRRVALSRSAPNDANLAR